LDIGKRALFAAQSSIEVTGNNISNVNTPGYSRRSVRLEEGMSIDYAPGQMGTGVEAKEVLRHFDTFIEEQYNTKSSNRERWDTLLSNLKNLEMVFNESGEGRLNEAMSKFWKAWQTLAQSPEAESTRSALLGDAETMLNAIHFADQSMSTLQRQMGDYINQDVQRVNEIIHEIAEVNKQIDAHEIEGRNNANQLRDERSTLVRELAKKIDINYINNGGGDITITTGAGQTLVDGAETFDIKYEGAQAFNYTIPGSNYDGSIHFDGKSDYEYTFEVKESGSGPVDADPTSGSDGAELKISVDGGETWLRDDDGDLITIFAQDEDHKVEIPNSELKVWFDSPSGNDLQVGDRFTVVPKDGLYWYKTSSSKENITPLIKANGESHERRVSEGSLAGYFECRDHYVGRYREKMDSLSKGLAWEVNRIHSQGAGLSKFSNVTGTNSVKATGAALGTDGSGLDFRDKLQAGNLSVFVYNKSTGQVQSEKIDFNDSTVTLDNFNPDAHSLEDLRDGLDAVTGISASISNNRLVIDADDGYEFAFGTDSTGLLAALGVNTFFDGNSADSIKLNSKVRNDLNHINAGHVNGAGEMNSGDNTTANSIAQLQHKNVELTTTYEGTTSQTLQEYYDALSGKVGSDTSQAEYNYNFNNSLAEDLNSRQEEIAGVNLDEEMSNLIKYQHSYTAAAKLVTTADRMIQTLLGMAP
jgi:flagellar hook-associated protein 1 FlgK